MKESVAASRVFSFLSLQCYFLGLFMTLALSDLLPRASQVNMLLLILFNFAGCIVGMVLCPVFFNEKKTGKNLALGIVFIMVVAIVRSCIWQQGVDVWLHSAPLRSVVGTITGIQNVMSYGFFYLTWLRGPHTRRSENRTGLFCPVVFSLAYLVPIVARHFTAALLAAAEPQLAVVVFFNIVRLSMVCQGIVSLLCWIFLNRTSARDADPADITAGITLCNTAAKTDLSMILRIIGLSAVFSILNAAMEMRLFGFVNYSSGGYRPFIPAFIVASPLLAFLAGRSIRRFIRWFLPPAIVLFILLPCLPLLEGYPLFNLIMSTLIAVFHFTTLVVFSMAVVEHYAGGFWFYGVVSATYLTNGFSFFGPLVGSFINRSTEFTVLYIAVSAAVFFFLSIGIFFPKTPQRSAVPQAEQNLDAAFRKRNLTEREADIARLIVEKGFGNKDISEKLFISEKTVEKYATNIYRRFNVKSRTEFVSLFVGK